MAKDGLWISSFSAQLVWVQTTKNGRYAGTIPRKVGYFQITAPTDSGVTWGALYSEQIISLEYRLYGLGRYISSSMIFENNNYREFLKTTLAEKAKNRDGYSLRAFSQKVGLSNSFLSEVLSGKKSLSVEAAFKVAIKLDLTESETQYLCLLVQLEQEKDPSFREELTKRLSSLNPSRQSFDLSVDLFKAISDWYHFAILELTYLPSFLLEAGNISKRLGISKIEAELAIDRLKRLELIEEYQHGKYKKAHNYILTQSTLPNEALKLHHKQILEKAIQSLNLQTPKERISATDIVAIDSKYLPEVDRLSLEFSSAVMKLAEKSKIKDCVYALSVHFFKLINNERTRNYESNI